MDTLNHIDRNRYLQVARKQAEVWTQLVEAISGDWKRSVAGGWHIQPEIRLEDVLEDLDHGRD